MSNLHYQCNAVHLCHCGMATKTPHVVGKDGCRRFRTRPPKELADDVWSVDGHHITGFTLREQRGYHQFHCGCWSRWQGSVNSLPDEMWKDDG